MTLIIMHLEAILKTRWQLGELFVVSFVRKWSQSKSQQLNDQYEEKELFLKAVTTQALGSNVKFWH